MRIAETDRIFKSNVCRPETFGQTHILSSCCPTSEDVAINLDHPHARNCVFLLLKQCDVNISSVTRISVASC